MFIRSMNLVLLAFATVFFPRLLAMVGFPAAINFLHFFVVALVFGYTLTKTRTYQAKQILKKFSIGLYAFLIAIFASAILNSAGIINIVLEFLLLTEPFLMLLAIVNLSLSQKRVEQMQQWIMGFALVHLVLAYFQAFTTQEADHVKGVFVNMGAGHHVGGAVSLTAAVYIIFGTSISSLLIRCLIAMAFLWETYPLSDSKQVIAVFAVALVMLGFTKLKSIQEVVQSMSLSAFVLSLVWWLSTQVFKLYWADPERITRGLGLKFGVFSVMASQYSSPLNHFFGLGPGHTIGRLGWMVSKKYYDLLLPFGVTSLPVFDIVWDVQEADWMTNHATGSSMFSLLFSWAGIVGDLGIVGLCIYCYLWFLVWRFLCINDLTKFFVLTVFTFGAVFSWMEEPAYMLFVSTLVGIQWQLHKSKEQSSLLLWGKPGDIYKQLES